MPIFKYRELEPTPAAAKLFTDWIQSLDEKFTEHQGYEGAQRDCARCPAQDALYDADRKISRLATANLDPRNVTLEAEYYGDMHLERYYPRKPLIWLWLQFDASPLGANQWLEKAFRQMLGRHIFAHMGERVRFFSTSNSASGTTCRSATTAGFIGTCCWMIAVEITPHERPASRLREHLFAHPQLADAGRRNQQDHGTGAAGADYVSRDGTGRV